MRARRRGLTNARLARIQYHRSGRQVNGHRVINGEECRFRNRSTTLRRSDSLALFFAPRKGGGGSAPATSPVLRPSLRNGWGTPPAASADSRSHVSTPIVGKLGRLDGRGLEARSLVRAGTTDNADAHPSDVYFVEPRLTDRYNAGMSSRGPGLEGFVCHPRS